MSCTISGEPPVRIKRMCIAYTLKYNFNSLNIVSPSVAVCKHLVHNNSWALFVLPMSHKLKVKLCFLEN